MDEETNGKKRKKSSSSSLLKDERFKALFNNPDFQVDMNSEEYALLNPVVSQLDRSRAKKLKAMIAEEEREEKIEMEREKEDNHGNNGHAYCVYFPTVTHVADHSNVNFQTTVRTKALFMTIVVQRMRNRGLKK